MLAVLLSLALAMPHPPLALRCYENVFDLAVIDDKVFAATDGGLIDFEGGKWSMYYSPPVLRSIESVGPLTVVREGDKRLVQTGWEFVESHQVPHPRKRSLQGGLQVPRDWKNRPEFTPARSSLELLERDDLQAVLQRDDELFAGTADGLYEFDGGTWTRCRLPSQIPNCRLTGAAYVGKRLYLASHEGIFKDAGDKWSQVSGDDFVRILRVEPNAWALQADGAVDEVTVSGNVRRDVLRLRVRHPSTTCIGASNARVLLGSEGGWVELGGRKVTVSPAELKMQTVTALSGRDRIRWVGTRTAGLWRFGQGKPRSWNSKNGLGDDNVTALYHARCGLVVATRTTGLFLLVGNDLKPIGLKGHIVRSMLDYRWLEVCADDGVWSAAPGEWQWAKWGIDERPTGLAAVNGEFEITTVHGLHIP